MPKLELKHNPELTKEQLYEVLSTQLADKGYEIGLSKLIGADIYIKKTGWVGVSIKLVQRSNSTFIRYAGYAPSAAVRLLLYGVITLLIVRPKWKALENEVKDVVSANFAQ